MLRGEKCYLTGSREGREAKTYIDIQHKQDLESGFYSIRSVHRCMHKSTFTFV